MLNILPQQQKNINQKEYTARRVAVGLGLVFAVSVISLALLAPSYFLVRVKAEVVRKELESTKKILDAKLPPKEIMSELTAAIRHAEALKPLREPVSISELIKIFEAKPSSIKITNIGYKEKEDDASSRATLTLLGKAPDRESLTAFGRVLESRVEFEAVDLPVSNFVKEHDIDFSMTITLK